MSELTVQQLAELYQDYFSVEHSISVNVQPFAGALPDQQALLTAIPAPFLLASDVNGLNSSALRSLNRLGEMADELATYLQQQAKKIDLLLHYVLRQQDNAASRYTTISYGGSGCSYISNAALQPLQVVEIKLFLDNNDGAVFCYGQVLSCQAHADGYVLQLVFNRIRDEDRELLVRASLHQQSRLLKQKAEQRQRASVDNQH
ncbi:PilZ domain-containing protein [Rheinheimera gaetbuli]